MADQAKSLGRRKSIVDLAFNTLRGRSSKHDNQDSKPAVQGQKTNGWDLFGSLRSSISPSRHQQENGPFTVRAQSSSPPKRGPLGVRLKRPDPSVLSPKLKRRKSLGDMLTLGRNSSRKGKASTISNVHSQPTLKPKNCSSSMGDGFLTLPEAAMEDYISESTLVKSDSPLASSNTSSHKNTFTVEPPTSQTLNHSRSRSPTEGIPSEEQSAIATPLAFSETKEIQVVPNFNLETIHEVRDSSPERSPPLSYAEVLNGEIPDWAVDINPDFKSRQASLNMQYNVLLDRSDMQWLTGVDATLEYNDQKVAHEMERKDYDQANLSKESHTDSLESIIAFTAARMSKNFQVNSTETENHRSQLEHRTSGSDSTAVTDMSSWEPLTRFRVPPNLQTYENLQTSSSSIWPWSNDPSPNGKEQIASNLKGKSAATDEITLETGSEVLGSSSMMKDTPASTVDDSSPYLRGGHERASSQPSLYTDPSPQMLRRGARNTKRVNSLDPPVSVNYPGLGSKQFACLSDALSDIFTQDYLDLSDHCKYDMVRGVIQTYQRSEQEPLHTLLQTAKNQDIIWTPNFRRFLPEGSYNIRRATPPGYDREFELARLNSTLIEDRTSRSNAASESSHFSQASTLSYYQESCTNRHASNTSKISLNICPRASSSFSSKWPLIDDHPGSYLVTSYDGPEAVPVQWKEYVGNKQLRTPSLTTMNSASAGTSIHYEQSRRASSRLLSDLQRLTFFDESGNSQCDEPYNMPIEDPDHLRTYLGSDYFSASDQDVSFTSESPESARKSQIHLTKELEEEGVASSLKDTNLTEAPKTKNWLDMVKEYKAAKLAMQSEVFNDKSERSSSPTEDIKSTVAQVSETTSLNLFGNDLDSEDGAGSVEDNLLSDSEFDSDDYTKKLATLQISESRPRICAENGFTSLDRQCSTLEALEQQLRSQIRRDSGISFASGFKFSNYQHFGSTSELHSNFGTSRCISQDLKTKCGNTTVADGNSNRPQDIAGKKSWFSADSDTMSDSDGGVPLTKNGDICSSRRHANNHSTRLMTPSCGIHLPSTTIHPDLSNDDSTPIRRTPTPHSGATTPVSQPCFPPAGLPDLGLHTAQGHMNSLMPFKNRSRVSSQGVNSSKEIKNGIHPGELVRRRRPKVEHAKASTKASTKARGIYLDCNDASVSDMSHHECFKSVDSGTEADDEEEVGKIGSGPFWQDYFTSQIELLKKGT